MRIIAALAFGLLLASDLACCQKETAGSPSAVETSAIVAGWDGTVPEKYDFCFGWETDTQYYARQAPRKYIDMNQWIADNAAILKMKYLIHTGDIINDYDMLYQWELAGYAMGLLDAADLPYGVLAGNHDVGLDLGEYGYFWRYFGTDKFLEKSWYGGSYNNNAGHYDLISAGGLDFIIVYIGWGLEVEQAEWMNQVLAEHSSRKAILCFHGYTNVKMDKENNTMLDATGQAMREAVVAKNPNVFLVLSGHYHGASYETAGFDDDGDGVAERTVFQICTDYQINAESGEGYFKTLYFDISGSKVYLSSYSPSLDDYNVYDEKTAALDAGGMSGTDTDKLVLEVQLTK